MRFIRLITTAMLAGGLVLGGLAGPGADHADAASKKTAVKALKVAAKQKGDPYRRGGNGPGSFDCSGLVQYSYKKAGKKLSRTSASMLKYKKVSKKNRRAGDILVFLKNGRAYHAALYAGHGKIWEAQRPGTSVKKTKIWSSRYVVRRP